MEDKGTTAFFCHIWDRRLFQVLSVFRSSDNTRLEAQPVQAASAVARRRGLAAR